MKKRAQADQKRADDQRLLRAWRAWHREQREGALAGPHGVAVKQVLDSLEDMSLRSAPSLIALLKEIDWRCVDGDVRFVVLHEINSAIVKLRESAGLPVIDDALPHERATGFLVCREILGWQQ